MLVDQSQKTVHPAQKVECWVGECGDLNKKCPLVGSSVRMLGPQLVALFGKGHETFRRCGLARGSRSLG